MNVALTRFWCWKTLHVSEPIFLKCITPLFYLGTPVRAVCTFICFICFCSQLCYVYVIFKQLCSWLCLDHCDWASYFEWRLSNPNVMQYLNHCAHRFLCLDHCDWASCFEWCLSKPNFMQYLNHCAHRFLCLDHCDWASCFEWCLSKPNFCTQLWASVR
jgi:hypothetical protein